jgi:hypothetical protein
VETSQKAPHPYPPVPTPSLAPILSLAIARTRSPFGRADIPVIVVGHTGCGGAIASFAQPPPSASDSNPPDTHLMQFLDPLIRFRHTLPEGSDVNDLIRENIKDGVGNLVVSPVCPFSSSSSSSPLPSCYSAHFFFSHSSIISCSKIGLTM